MSQTDAAAHRRLMHASRTPGEINAMLFGSLADFLVWGHQHSDVAVAYPEFGALLERAATALGEAGTADGPDCPAEG
jgi:hypothetical protein